MILLELPACVPSACYEILQLFELKIHDIYFMYRAYMLFIIDKIYIVKLFELPCQYSTCPLISKLCQQNHSIYKKSFVYRRKFNTFECFMKILLTLSTVKFQYYLETKQVEGGMVKNGSRAQLHLPASVLSLSRFPLRKAFYSSKLLRTLQIRFFESKLS